jgi:hypothetical protein
MGRSFQAEAVIGFDGSVMRSALQHNPCMTQERPDSGPFLLRKHAGAEISAGRGGG